MSTLITVLHVIVCLFLMLTVLLQQGKGGGMGGAFGGGNAATVFGGSGASTFLRKLTAGAATIFMCTSMILAYIASHNAADALEKFGETQARLRTDKEAARAKAIDTTPGEGSGSAAPAVIVPSESPEMPDATGNPAGGATGSAVTPSEVPVPAGDTTAKPNPSTPAGMNPAPAAAEKPAPGTTTPPSGKVDTGTQQPAAGGTAPASSSPSAPQ